ncbi:MAG: DUF1501 domain-containing protein, partial [Planctomycetales bacterium]|nr:DUF1501 domain-containing protein [Planctomycetales bacterium]
MTITVSRRTALRAAGLGVATWGASKWLPQIAPALATSETRKRQFILLWMAGGPSQLDTFDLKPEHINGGSFKPIATNVNGIQISEHLPQLSQQLDHLAIVRSLTSKEGDHGRGTYFARTGQRPMSVLNYPALPASVAYQLNDTNT